MRRPGAERASTPPSEVRPPWSPSRRAQRPRRRRPGGRPRGSARRVGHGQGVGQAGGPWLDSWGKGRGDPARGAPPRRRLGPPSFASFAPCTKATPASAGPGPARRVGHAGGPGWIRGGKEEETRRGARQHWSVVTPAATERASQLSGAQCCVINLYHHVTKRNSSSLLLPPLFPSP